MVARVDGLVIAGGADVAPAEYGEPAHPSAGDPRPDRDQWELALLRAADEVRLPTLGVCRGMQVMAVGAGGVLEQHLPDLVGHEHHSPGADVFGDVAVSGRRGEPAARPGAADELGVHCHHHQSVRTTPASTRSPGPTTARGGDGTTGRAVLPGRAVAPGGGRRRRPLPGAGRR